MGSNGKLVFLFCLLYVVTVIKSDNSKDHLLLCLSSAGVHNFTAHQSPSYNHLLYASLYNLRYTGPNTHKPHAIILPESKQQLATAIQCSRQASWEIRIRCGGHSFEGMSSVGDTPFVIIDMMNLNRVTIDLESESAWVEGGAILGDVYHAVGTSTKSHGVSAGVSHTVGVGGHVSGGGNGMLARKYGLAADNVLDAIVIDADGRMMDRKEMGEDLFWAIRGGGGGVWGAVYAWKIRLLRIPETVTVSSITRSGTIRSAANILHKWQLVAPDLEDDFYLMVTVQGNQGTSITMLFQALYLGSKSSAVESITRVFPELGFAEHECKEMTWIEAVAYHSNLSTIDDLKNRNSGQKYFIKEKYDYVRSPISVASIEGALKMLASMPKASLAFLPYGGKLSRIPSDAIAFPHRKGNIYALMYYIIWQKEDDGQRDKYLESIRALYKYMTPFVSKEPRAVYVNGIDLDLGAIKWGNNGTIVGYDAVQKARSWGEKYFLGNYDRLVRVKTKIDPKNVFRHPQSIPPLSFSH